jgi:hypothetical protein
MMGPAYEDGSTSSLWSPSSRPLVLVSLRVNSMTAYLQSLAITLIYLPDAPTKARWADDDLKSRFVERVRSNNQGLKNKKWNSEQAWEAAKDPFAYCLFAFALCQTLIVGGIGKFNSLLINQAFGFDVLTSQLLKIPMSLCGVAFYYLMA